MLSDLSRKIRCLVFQFSDKFVDCRPAERLAWDRHPYEAGTTEHMLQSLDHIVVHGMNAFCMSLYSESNMESAMWDTIQENLETRADEEVG